MLKRNRAGISGGSPSKGPTSVKRPRPEEDVLKSGQGDLTVTEGGIYFDWYYDKLNSLKQEDETEISKSIIPELLIDFQNIFGKLYSKDASGVSTFDDAGFFTLCSEAMNGRSEMAACPSDAAGALFDLIDSTVQSISAAKSTSSDAYILCEEMIMKLQKIIESEDYAPQIVQAWLESQIKILSKPPISRLPTIAEMQESKDIMASLTIKAHVADVKDLGTPKGGEPMELHLGATFIPPSTTTIGDTPVTPIGGED